MTQPIEIDTPRLRLRQWQRADRDPFASLNADPRVMEFFPARLDRSASDAMADRCEALIAQRGWGFWAAELRQTRQFVGFVGLHVPSAELPFSPCVEIGWRLAAAFWGQGLATEAASAALDLAFGRLALPDIVSFTALGNLRSQRVMQRLGMQRAPSTFEHPGVPSGSPLRAHCLYRLSRSQWHQRQAASPTAVVIDTNIALDLLVFDDPACAPLAAALAAGELQWLATAAMRDELARVLGYPLIAARLAQTGRDAEGVLMAFDARVKRLADAPPRAPCACSDPDDQVFIDLAAAHRARLLSKDRAVLAMRRRLAALGVDAGAGLSARPLE